MKSKTNPKMVADLQRQQQAVTLRASGATYQQIADQLGFSSAQSAHRSVQQALKNQGRGDREELAAIEAVALDTLQRKMFKQALEGSTSAVDSVLKIMGRRAKLFGLDDYESRMAAAAEKNADSNAAMSSWIVDAVQDVVFTALQPLNLPHDQWQGVVAHLVDGFDRITHQPSPTEAAAPDDEDTGTDEP